MQKANKYLAILIKQLQYATTKMNVQVLVNKIIENITIKLWIVSLKKSKF